MTKKTATFAELAGCSRVPARLSSTCRERRFHHLVLPRGSFAPCPASVAVDDGLTIQASLAQTWLRQCWEDFGAWFHEYRRGRPFGLLLTGDLIVVDAYRQPYVPFYLATREFFRLVREHAEGGDDEGEATAEAHRHRVGYFHPVTVFDRQALAGAVDDDRIARLLSIA